MIVEEYESLLEDMSRWIAERTWGGHERECPAFAGADGACNCIESVRSNYYRLKHDREVADLKREDFLFHAPDLMRNQTELQELRHAVAGEFDRHNHDGVCPCMFCRRVVPWVKP